MEKEVEEERLRKETEEAASKAREEMDASRLEDEIVLNKLATEENEEGEQPADAAAEESPKNPARKDEEVVVKHPES